MAFLLHVDHSLCSALQPHARGFISLRVFPSIPRYVWSLVQQKWNGRSIDVVRNKTLRGEMKAKCQRVGQDLCVELLRGCPAARRHQTRASPCLAWLNLVMPRPSAVVSLGSLTNGVPLIYALKAHFNHVIGHLHGRPSPSHVHQCQ
jgi:hypothetical protein